MVKKLSVCITLIFATFQSAPAQNFDHFLLNPAGARAVGMGGAQTALADDGFYAIYNPAGLAIQASAERAYLAVDPWLDFISTSAPMPGSLAAGLFLQRGPDYGNNSLTDPDGNRLGQFSLRNWAISMNLAGKLGGSNAIGFNVKWVRNAYKPVLHDLESAESLTGSTIAIDLGWLFRPGNGRWRLGVNLANVGSKIEIDGLAADPLPQTLRIGTAILPLNSRNHRLAIAYDISRPLFLSDREASPWTYIFRIWADDTDLLENINHHFGMEYCWHGQIAFRSGYAGRRYPYHTVDYFNLGFGISVDWLSLDISNSLLIGSSTFAPEKEWTISAVVQL